MTACRECGQEHPDTIDGVRCDLALHGEDQTRALLASLDLTAAEVDELIREAQR